MKRPQRLQRLPEQYFVRLLQRNAAAAARAGEPLVDLGRGNPDVPPPQHVVDALVASARSREARVHGYAPFAGLPELREAIAVRYSRVYGVDLDPEREVAIVAGTKSALTELVLALAERGDTVLLPDPYYPDYPSGIALAGARQAQVRLDPERGYAPRFDEASRDGVAAVFLNYPSNPAAAVVPEGAFEDAVAFAAGTGAAVIHDFAYGDLVFDDRTPQSFLATDGAREAGVELFSMSKSYGMAGWRLGFVLGNAEIVARLHELQVHVHAGIFEAVQRAGVAALTGPQDTVEERRLVYQRRRDRVLARIGEHAAPCEGTFYAWLRLPDGVSAERLLDEHRVAVAPGEGFGPSAAGWARISLATPDDVLDAGVERLVEAFAR